jgi:hypothetical protein
LPPYERLARRRRRRRGVVFASRLKFPIGSSS